VGFKLLLQIIQHSRNGHWASPALSPWADLFANSTNLHPVLTGWSGSYTAPWALGWGCCQWWESKCLPKGSHLRSSPCLLGALQSFPMPWHYSFC